MDISLLLKVPVRQLSLGQRMRCEVVAALLHNPKILFLDEPTIGLDAVSKLALRDFLKNENRLNGVTMILTTHDRLAFFTVKGLDWIYIFTNTSYQITRCPIDYMPKILWSVFTFFMPMLVVSFYPASAICGWGSPRFIGFLALPAGLAFLGFSLLIWRVGVKHYKSTGS
ncbi:MAG: ABC-2 family transporter protein [Clostridiales bacterium]|jgi:ABC-type uncharacterized transport system permease subunit|nr:ABC-2 family transporter protein [Clostridiales bacterium]